MKTLMLLLLFSTISLSLAQPSPDPVRDVDGKLLRTGKKYYILPAFRGAGGGIALGSIRNESCPLDVVQAKLKFQNGLPLTFTPNDPKKGVIRELTDLNIKFSASSTCTQSKVWNLRLYDKRYIVAANGVSGNPGPATISNWFMIRKFEDGYKLVFCPKVCKVCRPPCGDIGIQIAKNGRRGLGLSSESLKVMFKKA